MKGITSSAEYIRDECLVLCKENRALLAENEGLEDVVELAVATNDRGNGVVRPEVPQTECAHALQRAAVTGCQS